MDKLKFISDQMAVIGIPYEFMEWTSAVTYPYFVGEITEHPVTTGDGKHESTMLLTGFHRGKYIDLERAKAKINQHFHPLYGLIRKTDNGYIAVFFDDCFYVPTNEADLKRIQITLKIKEWKVT